MTDNWDYSRVAHLVYLDDCILIIHPLADYTFSCTAHWWRVPLDMSLAMDFLEQHDLTLIPVLLPDNQPKLL